MLNDNSCGIGYDRREGKAVEERKIMAFAGDTRIGVKGRILVMDDEEGIRILAGAMLEDMGYEVQVTQNGDEAILSFRKEREAGRPFDFVILDLQIPGGIGGEEVVKKIREVDPRVRAIVSSGIANTPVMDNFRKYGFDGVLPKPYSRKDLDDTLAGVSPGSFAIDL